jgi:hypothetical protein
MKLLDGITLVDRCIRCARHELMPRLWLYYSGAVPFALALLYFIIDLSSTGTDEHHTAMLSGLLAASFLWMKCWHALFGLKVYESLSGAAPARPGIRSLLRCAAWQAILGPLGLVAVPVCMVLVVPFAWCYAFFQTASVLPLVVHKNLWSESLRCAMIRPVENHLFLWVICPVSLLVSCACISFIPQAAHAFGSALGTTVLVAVITSSVVLSTLAFNPFGGILLVNVLTAVAILPQLMKLLFGWESLYSMSPRTLFHPGMIMTAWVICFLFMDPIVKIGYVLRKVDDEAAKSGQDLLLRLRRISPVAVFVVFALGTLLLHTGAQAAEIPSPTALDESIKQVLAKPSYAWREAKSLHTAIKNDPHRNSLIARFTAGVKKTVKKILHWIRKAIRFLFRDKPAPTHSGRWGFPVWASPRSILVALAVVVAAALVFYFAQFFFRRSAVMAAVQTTVVSPQTPEKTLETLSADENPPDEWELMARESRAAGDLRGAARYLFLSTLSLLGGRSIIRLRKSGSNREYLRETGRRFPDRPELQDSFQSVVRGYEYAWFGGLDPNAGEIDALELSHGRVKEWVTAHA